MHILLGLIINNSKEIKALRTKNDELMNQLKRFSQEVEVKMARIKFTKPEDIKPESVESTLLNELDCAKKWITFYKTEMELLQGKLKMNIGSEKVIKQEKMLALNNERYTSMMKQIKEMKQQIKQTGKIFQKTTSNIENGVTQLEESRTLQILNKEIEKSEKLGKKLKEQGDVQMGKEQKITEFTEKIKEIEGELEKLRKDMPEKTNENDKPIEETELLTLELNTLKDKFDREVQKNAEEKNGEEAKLLELKAQFKDISQVKLFGLILYIEK